MAKPHKKGLGRGLDALLSSQPEVEPVRVWPTCSVPVIVAVPGNGPTQETWLVASENAAVEPSGLVAVTRTRR